MTFLDPYGAGMGPAGFAPQTAQTAFVVPTLPLALRYSGQTGDWSYDANGEYAICHPADQAVALALCIRQGDIKTAPTVGSRISKLTLGRDIQGAVEDAVRTAVPLASFLADGSITLLKIEHEIRPQSGIAVRVTYRNNALGTTQTITSPSAP